MSWPATLGDTCFTLGRYQEAIDAYREGLRRDPTDGGSVCFSRHFRFGVGSGRADLSLEQVPELTPYQNPDPLNRLLDGVRRAGLPE